MTDAVRAVSLEPHEQKEHDEYFTRVDASDAGHDRIYRRVATESSEQRRVAMEPYASDTKQPESFQHAGEVANTMAEMPRYKCHKIVHALKITRVVLDIDRAREEGRETDGSAMLIPEDIGYAPFKVYADYVRKHNPAKGPFYYVVYAPDGYASLSPIQAFEEGYTRI